MVNKFRPAMLISSVDIARLMVHAEQIEEQNLNKVGKELKRTRAEDGNSSKSWFKVQDKMRFRRGSPTQILLILQGSIKV